MKKDNVRFLRFTGVVAVLFVAVFIAWVFTGCSATGNKDEPQASTEPTSAQKQWKNANKELNISLFREDAYVSLAAKKYEESHSGIKINVNAYMNANDSGADKTSEKYTQILSTSLMSGKGDDIIDVSPISFFKLADKDMLLDLSEPLKESLNNDDYYMSVINAYQYHNKLYCMPISFVYDAYSLNQETAKALGIKMNERTFSLDTIKAYAEQIKSGEKTALFDDSASGMSDVSLAYKLFSLNMPKFVKMETKEVSIENNQEFISILKAVKNIADKKQIATQAGYTRQENFYDGINQSLINIFGIYSPSMCQSGVVDYTAKNLKLLTNKEGYSTFGSYSAIPAINNKTKNKDLAIDFVRFLISKEMQTSTELMYCPVNKAAVKEASQLIVDNAAAEGYLPQGFTHETLDTNIKVFNEMAQNTTMLEFTDMVIRDFTMDEMTRFFAAEESAEQAAKNLQAKIDTYLKE